MNYLPNILSLVRIILVPLILWLLIQDLFIISAVIITIVGFTDYFDGYLARKYNSESLLGFYLDAIADKVLIITIYLILGIKLILPTHLIILIVFREVLISGAYLLKFILDLKFNFKPILISKINTFLQIALIVFVCLMTINQFNQYEAVMIARDFLIAIVTITTIVSLLLYIIIWLKAVGKE
ncbi:CDP-alcohol phosphatidyltransferase family protein [Pelagibacteraceae bacterium]|nr:CDP-alcohol phosphatidyltransferase family protein [Pelagibacteraceae bacterium]